MRSSSLKQLLDSGIKSPRDFRDKLIHDWFLTFEETKYLDEYVLTALPVSEFFELIREGEISWGKFTYQIIWVHKPATVRQSGKAIVSFRYCRMLGCGYALVKKNNIEKETILQHRNTIETDILLLKDNPLPSLLKRS